MPTSRVVYALVVWAGMLLVLACPPAAAAPVSAHATPAALNPASAQPLAGSPLEPADRLGGSSEGSTNWAGYEVCGDYYTSVSAAWTQPSIAPNLLTDAGSQFWVGFDGDGGADFDVEQCGIAAASVGGVVSYHAFVYVYPNAEVQLPLTVNPGDSIVCSATNLGNGDFPMTIDDLTTGGSYSGGVTCLNAPCCSAEIIAEAPQLPLADFGSITFTGCSIDGQPLSAFDWNRIELYALGGTSQVASTSALSPGGDGFSVTSDLAPTTTVSGATGAWSRKPLTLAFAAKDGAGGYGVSYTQHAVDGGGWVQGDRLTLPAPRDHTDDGTHTVRYCSVDKAGEVGSVQTCLAKIDTLGPVCAARSVTVGRGRACRLYFKVHDTLSPRVTRILTITTRSGVVEKRWSWGYATNFAGWWSLRYTCKLARGTYLIRVCGKDLAGNPQSLIGRAYLRVR